MFDKLIDECRLRNYSQKTIKSYLLYNKKFFLFCRKKPQNVTADDIKEYLLHLVDRKRSPSTINLAHNAINFYMRTVHNRNFKKVPFQKREDRVKDFLSLGEIKHLVDAIPNMKHKLLINMIYSSGVRVSELVKIKVADLDLDDKLLLVRQGKRKKDRYTILSDNIINNLKSYLQDHDGGYLFPSKNGHLTASTVQQILKKAKKKVKINKPVSPHILRHSFATHLKELGTQDSVIQKLLGHNDPRTTQVYSKVTNNYLKKIKSPHDFLSKS